MTTGSTTPQDCTHSFTWHGVVPPSHCPQCGRCLGCGGPWAVPYPVYPAPKVWPTAPQPWQPWNPGPYWYVTTSDAVDDNTVYVINGNAVQDALAGAAE